MCAGVCLSLLLIIHPSFTCLTMSADMLLFRLYCRLPCLLSLAPELGSNGFIVVLISVSGCLLQSYLKTDWHNEKLPMGSWLCEHLKLVHFLENSNKNWVNCAKWIMNERWSRRVTHKTPSASRTVTPGKTTVTLINGMPGVQAFFHPTFL